MKLNADKNGVCSIVILKDFESLDWGMGLMNNVRLSSDQLKSYDPETLSFESWKKNLLDISKKWDQNALKVYNLSDGNNQCLHRLALVMATTSNLQKTTEQFLADLGFTQLGPYEKLKHKNSKLSVWIMPAPEFMKAIGYEGIPV